MTKPWTYLSLKAVFQYMDGNKRLELNSHCPALRSAENSVSLNLQFLTLEKEKIVVNEVCYKVESKYQRIKSILNGRKHVRVENLEIYDLNVIPDSLKFRTRNLDSGDLDFERVLPFIDRANFPLKELRVNISKTPNLEKYLGFTQTLILFVTNYNGEMEDLVRSILYNRKCPNIELENFILSSNTTVALIENWRHNQKNIGTVMVMYHKYREVQIYVDDLLEGLDGRFAYFNNSALQLEVNSHCPALRSAESSVPLSLQSLILKKRKIVANDVCYKVESKSQRIKSILDGRKLVRVEILKIRNSSVIPDSLKFRTRNLDSGNLNLESVLPFINRASFPLKELRVNISKTPNLKKYLRCTQALVLFETNLDQEKSDWIRSVLYDRKGPNIVLENCILSSDDTIALIQNWSNNQKEIGSVLTIHHEYGDLPLSDVAELMDVFNGRNVYFNDSVLQLELNFHCPALRSAESSVPLNLQSLTLTEKKIVANDVCYKKQYGSSLRFVPVQPDVRAGSVQCERWTNME
ncbi:hypothetical protein GCK72_007273 [Caenorhabditis remanei]|uniref:Uncharacterized protein n=1 Tax=Caenorhabditis remanei TaxID=31234 RepID=A0A6A5HJM5_CAERE|nr:hypothetical protein GCK72_007270 [Caenorhabditis remanei]XP_053590273.1 hypothetical protein GCK72_007273 [Caenorhabditis remanei]KAF1767311.1 hypothetical protein GCK72_007270 [Caenorhabditis remanei]KAF1767314.1 hypothetical protein GCK72_007273 [Caenorhabditis remanei]